MITAFLGIFTVIMVGILTCDLYLIEKTKVFYTVRINSASARKKAIPAFFCGLLTAVLGFIPSLNIIHSEYVWTPSIIAFLIYFGHDWFDYKYRSQ